MKVDKTNPMVRRIRMAAVDDAHKARGCETERRLLLRKYAGRNVEWSFADNAQWNVLASMGSFYRGRVDGYKWAALEVSNA